MAFKNGVERYKCPKAKDWRWRYAIYVRPPGTAKLLKRRASGFESKDDAESAASAIKNLVKQAQHGIVPVKSRPTLAALIGHRLPTIANGHERQRAKRVLNAWLELLPDGFQIQAVETEHIRRYVERRQRDGQSPSSVDRELNIISATLNQADEFYPALAQWKRPKIPRQKLPKTRRERIITDDEYRRILAYLQRPRAVSEAFSPYQRRLRGALLLRFALLTGMRPKEIWKLRWEDIDTDNGRIRVRGTKTENRGNSLRYVPLTSDTASVIEQRQALAESLEYVFSISGSPRDPDYDLIKEACAANGIPYGRSVTNGFELYCARHTFTTKLLMAGLSLAEVGAITGHSDRELVLYYSHVVPESAARAVSALERIEQVRLKSDYENQNGGDFAQNSPIETENGSLLSALSSNDLASIENLG
jgi:integrase